LRQNWKEGNKVLYWKEGIDERVGVKTSNRTRHESIKGENLGKFASKKRSGTDQKAKQFIMTRRAGKKKKWE